MCTFELSRSRDKSLVIAAMLHVPVRVRNRYVSWACAGVINKYRYVMNRYKYVMNRYVTEYLPEREL